MNRQKLALLILLALFAMSLVYSFVRMPRQERAATADTGVVSAAARPAPRPGGGPVPPKPAGGADQPANQNPLALLEPAEAQFKGYKRNIFKPIFREEMKIVPLPPPPPAPPQKSILPSKPAPAAADVPPPASPTPAETAKKDMGRLKFLGFLKKDAQKTIFLAEGAEIFLVRKGDRIAGKYQVSGLTDEAITINVLADKSDLVFPLVENRSLMTAGK